MKNIFKKTSVRHVGRPSNKELRKRMTIKVIIALIVVLSLGGGIYLYINRDFINFGSIFGNSSVYNEAIMKKQTDNSLKLVTFNPNKKKKFSGSLYFLQYYHTDGSNIFDYYFDMAGHNDGKYERDRVEVYYNGKYITTFKRKSKYFYVKQNWAGRTVVLKTIGIYSGNKEKSKYIRLYIPKTLKLGTVKFSGKHYYIVKNASAFYKHEKEKSFYQSSNSYYENSSLGFAKVYANAIRINDFSIIKDQTGLINGNNAILKNSSFTLISNIDKSKIVKRIYDELGNNKPVILKVNGDYQGTYSSYIVVIGINVDFDANKIKESDFLILDVWDGNAEKISGKGESNGIDNWSSRYMINDKEGGSKYGYEIFVIS